MPYINKTRRADIDRLKVSPVNVGELTYVLTHDVISYMLMGPNNFQRRAEVVAALVQTLDEFQRRVIHPYEDTKWGDEGDVYPRELTK